MSDQPAYTPYHPRWHRRRLSTWWWLKKGSYVTFILREVSSVFVAWFVAYLLLLIYTLSQGSWAYEWFLRLSRHPLMLALNLVSLFFVVFHAVTWFNLAPQALVARVGGKRVPGAWIAASNYALWLVVSAVVAWLILGG